MVSFKADIKWWIICPGIQEGMDLPTLNCWLRRIISSMRRSVSSPDKTLRKELKLRGVFLTKFEAFHLVMKRCVSNAWHYFSNRMILGRGEGREGGRNYGCKKWAVFHLISKHSLNIKVLCIFFMNYYLRNNDDIITCVLLLNIVDVHLGAKSVYKHSTQTTPNK